MEDFTTSLTNHFRVTGSSNYNDAEHLSVVGRSERWTVCTRFDWQWLLFPIILTVMVVALLVWSISGTFGRRAQPVWKSSLLPLLYYGFESGEKEEEAAQLAELEGRAEKERVVFEDGPQVGFVRSNKEGL